MDSGLMVTKVNGNSTSTFGGDVDVTGNVIQMHQRLVQLGAAQTVTQLLYKTKFNTEEFDTNTKFDFNLDFTPTVDGYYNYLLSV